MKNERYFLKTNVIKVLTIEKKTNKLGSSRTMNKRKEKNAECAHLYLRGSRFQLEE